MICPKCFSTNDDANNNCTSCGNALKSSDTINQEVVSSTVPEFTPASNTVPEVKGLNNETTNEVAKEEVSVPAQATVNDDPFMNQVLNSQPKEKKSIDFKGLFERYSKDRNVRIGALAVVAIVGVVGLYNVLHKPSEKELLKQQASYTESFFFKGDESYSTLYSDKGKKLSKDKFDTTTSFVDGAALVTNDDGKRGVISDKGKMLVPYDKYDLLYRYGGLYVATDDDGAYLLSSRGKKVLTLDDNYDTDYDASGSTSLMLNTEKNAILYSYKGKKIATLPYDDDEDMMIDESGNYAVAYSGGKNVLYDINTAKVIAKFEAKSAYCINGANEEGTEFSLYTCDGGWFDYASDDDDYKVVIKGKVIDVNDECDKASSQYDTLICVSDGDNYLINKKGKKTINMSEKDVAYIDAENYAVQEDDDVVFYVGNKKKATVKDANINDGRVYSDIYLLRSDDEYVYYDKNGKKISKHEVDSASSHNEEGFALLRNNDKYFVIDKKGNVVGEKYDYITAYGKYFVVKDDDKYGVMNSKGKLIVDTKYDSINPNTVKLEVYFELEKDEKHSLYVVKNKKEVIKDKEDLSFYDHYVIAEEDDDKVYYTYNGKEFYKSSK